MKRYLRGIFFVVAILLSRTDWAASQHSLNPDDDNWEQLDKVGIVTIYTRPYPNSSIKAFKAFATINLPLAQIAAALADPSSGEKWIDGCLSSKTLEGKNFNDRVGYALSELPWPFTNRDVIFQIITKNPSSASEIVIEVRHIENRQHSEDPAAVRIPSLRSTYYLRAKSETATDFIWTQHTEPGGTLPAWLINQKIIDLPSLSIPKLAALAAKKRYQGAWLIFDANQKIKDVSLASGLHLSDLYPMLLTYPKPIL